MRREANITCFLACACCHCYVQEKKAASEVVAVSIGPKAAGDTIRTALAMGADRGIHVMTDEAIRIDQGLEPLAVAGLLKKVPYFILYSVGRAIQLANSRMPFLSRR